MGIFLTLVDSKSLAYGTPPDENYARELMQLFTIGLFELELDGTPMCDEAGVSKNKRQNLAPAP